MESWVTINDIDGNEFEVLVEFLVYPQEIYIQNVYADRPIDDGDKEAIIEVLKKEYPLTEPKRVDKYSYNGVKPSDFI